MEQKPSVAAHSVRHTNHIPVAAHSVRHGGRCQWRTLCAATCCILFVAVLLWSILSIRAIISSQTLQYEAQRWQGPSEQTYSQVAVFWSDGEMDAGKTQMLAAELQASFPTEEIPPFVTAWGAKSSGLAVYGHRRVEAELWSVSERISLNILLKQLSLINNYQIHCITIAFKDLRRSKDPFQMMMA